jgi:predicted ATP-grasp superfamily ATP-dependent carboligase
MVDLMRSERPLACVLGDIETVRPLALAGIRSAVVAQPGDPARYSRFVDTVIERIGPGTEPTKLVDRLLEYAQNQHARPVLYYDGDSDLLLVSRYREALAEGFRFVVAETELVEDLVAKDRFQALADRHDLPVPRARRLDLVDDQSTGELDLTFPIILKPLTRHHALWKPLSDAKAIRFDDRAALERALPALAEQDVSFLVQELIPGPESCILSYHVYVDADGEIAGEFAGRKIRTYPRGFGYSTALETTDDSSVIELGRELTRRLGLRGVAKFDLKRGEDGALYLLEVNPRFSLWHHLGARAGVNLPLLVYRDLVGLPRPEARPVRSGVRWVSPLRDRRAAREEGISFIPWLKWTLGCEAKAYLAWNDPMPAIRAFAKSIEHRLRRKPSQRDADGR